MLFIIWHDTRGWKLNLVKKGERENQRWKVSPLGCDGASDHRHHHCTLKDYCKKWKLFFLFCLPHISSILFSFSLSNMSVQVRVSRTRALVHKNFIRSKTFWPLSQLSSLYLSYSLCFALILLTIHDEMDRERTRKPCQSFSFSPLIFCFANESVPGGDRHYNRRRKKICCLFPNYHSTHSVHIFCSLFISS